ncbi:MAG TPA: translation initiation factor [Puia sp.]|jgi:translation initiation factor 1|nr:translation initiation factor [Puia sp.]
MRKKKPGSNGIVYSTDPNFRPEEEPVSQERVLPRQQRLKVRLDTRQRAGKAVTLVEGYVGPESELEELGRQLKAYCGTGGSVKDGLIIIQGDQREKITPWLLKNDYAQTKRI